jgi:hypothetical protein
MTAATHLSCDVCAVVEPGREPRVEVAKGSGQPRMDALALSVVTAAVGRRPVAPDVKASRACYTFDLLSTRVPPMPMVGCGFDETTASLSCYWPLKKMVKLKMRLDSVEPIAPKR